MSTRKQRRRGPAARAAAGPDRNGRGQELAGPRVPSSSAPRRATSGRRPTLYLAAGAAALLIVLLLALALLPPGALPSFLRFGRDAGGTAAYSPLGRISFVRASSDGKQRDLYIVNPDGTGQQQVTHDIPVQGTNRWSPDGRRILIQATVSGVSTIVRITAGPDNKPTETVQLTADVKADSGLPSWSPDGSMVAFQSKRDGGDYQVFVMNSDSSGKRRLSGGKGYAGQPEWSPDGKSVVYVAGDAADPGKPKEIFVAQLAGGAPAQITHLGKDLSLPQFTPDGKQILCMQNDNERQRSILAMAAGGAALRTLVQGGTNFEPAISPQGDRIAYASISADSGSDVFVLSLPGGSAVNLTADTPDDYGPNWSPDGTELTWASTQATTRTHKIVIANADGSDLKVISSGDGEDYQPAWGAPVK